MRLLSGVCLALSIWLTPAAAGAQPPVWVVKDHDATMVLFGSVHVLPPGADWRPPELTQALAGADQVWFEAPMDAAGLQQATKEAQAHGYLPQGQSLRPMLSKGGRQRLEAAAKLVGLPVAAFDPLEPWFAELLIQDSLFKVIGVDGADGVEQQLWAGLSPGAKRVTLETPEQQIEFFAGAPMSEQLASLEQALKDVPHAKSDYDKLFKAWMDGDIKDLTKEVIDPLRKTTPGLYDRVVRQRNARWVQAIDARLKAKGRTVMVVGMGHLIGPDGVPARLRAQGIEVDGPR
jgi:hypothetical protein